ncbi:helix-turn-helix domain-containing protein [Streptomyces sp. NPDC048142]|uniref:helix-turn-helix domain-containing protein n=1 Tax=Streptomyces sp. NPDC048142 TaxID=3365501 RepID=UPI0037117031
MTYQPPTALPRDLIDEEEMHRALVGHDFGAVFRLARDRAGISFSKIATECDIKPNRVGELAKGRGRITTFEKIVQIADALRVPGQVLGLAPRPWEADSPGHSSEEIGPSVRRRTILQAATATGLAAALPALHSPEPPSRITPGYIEELRARAARLRRLDIYLGGGDTYRVYLAEVQRMKSLLRGAVFTDDARQRATALLAEQAQQAGWSAFDGGRTREAADLYEESRDLAREASDPDLYGNALAFLAYKIGPDDRQAAVAVAEASCTTITARTPSTVRALLHERHAWACAVDGQVAGTERALEAAREALDSAQDGEPQPDWAAWVDDVELDIMTGRCWTELRRPLRAVPALTRALGQYSDDNARDKSLYLSWLAQAYLTADEVEVAAQHVHRAAALARGVASQRPAQRLVPLINHLRPHAGLPAVRELLESTAA